MSTYTQHKGLEKPLSTEKYNVAVANKNSDVIDSELHKLDLKNQSQDELLATKEALNAEIIRATSVEDNIADNLTNEINRATASETGVSNGLSAHISDKTNPHNVSKSQIGLGNVENKSSATIRSEITKSNVTNALGYTPYTPNEVDNKLSALETNIDWKESVATFGDIATTYPEPRDGWTVNVNDTDYTYRYNGTSWIPISANAIPKVTDSVDGLLSKEDHAKYEDANSKKHTHSNKSILDGITAALITAWNNAVEHITDSIKHITSAERTNWNAAKTHADSPHAPSNAERNVIVTVKKNGDTVAPDDSRAINITIPTKTSELTNDSGFKTTDTTYSNFVKSGSGAKAGLVPAPSTTAGTTKYLREDGTWQVPPDTNLMDGGNVNGSLIIGNPDDISMGLYNDGIHGDGEQSLDNFHSVSAATLYYDDEDLDERYVKQGDLTPESIGALSSKQLTSQNLNDTKNPGLYYGAGGNTVKNKPSGINNFGVAVLKSASGWVTQVLYGSDKKKYTRWYDGSTWTEWAKDGSDASISGDLDMSNSKIWGNLDSNTRAEVDFNGTESLELGLRKISPLEWISLIHFSNNSIHIETPEELIMSNKKTKGYIDWKSNFYLKLFDNDITLSNTNAMLNIDNSGHTYLGVLNGANVNLTSSGDASLQSSQNGHAYVQGYKAVEISSSNGKVQICSKEKDIELLPGTDGNLRTPATGKYVKTGNIQGLKLADGTKPSISNYGRIGAELVDAGDMYGTLHGDVYYNYEYEDIQPDGILKTYGYSQFEVGSFFSFTLYKHAEKKYDEGGETELRSNENMSYSLNQYAFHPTVFAGGQPDLGYGGGARYRWNNVYAVNGTIQTSDRNEKNTIEELPPEQALSLLMGLVSKTYKMNNGTSGRTHWGFISQDIEELLEELGWSSLDFGGFIKSPKTIIVEEEEEYEDKDENGNTIVKTRTVQKEQVVEGEYVYSLRYDEFIAPIVKVEQGHENRLNEQDEQIKVLENTVQSQQKEIEKLKQAIYDLKEMIENGN